MSSGTTSGPVALILVAVFAIFVLVMTTQLKNENPGFSGDVYELRCGLGTDGTGPIFTGVKRIQLSDGVVRMTFIEDGQTFYKMRDGEYCMPTTVAP